MITSRPVTLNPASKSDCRTIAELYRISSDGVADYVWTRMAQPGEDLLDVGQRRYENEDSAFSYRNCTLAVAGDEILGMLVAFPMHVDPEARETDPVLAPFAVLEEDASYYICGVAVFPPHRGQGIGTRMLALAESQARAAGLDKLSLIVFEQNAGALALYRRLGYVERAREAIVPHPLLHYGGDALLMVKALDRA